ncbi:MAG: nucleotidyltransferase domain-containing protein, partial [Candidatus Thermoplasmatota archaeon]|nr:nucleotidyltransferase domain-containing protein [Candidatus Thermoplasmatota archaeon]
MKTEIIDVLSWAAVFDRGLKSSEVLRYLTKKSTIEEVSAVLGGIDEFEQRAGRWYLTGKEYPGLDYEKRIANANRHIKEGLPVVSKLCETSSILGVAITGSLASGSSIEGADLDLLIVTKADYVWRVRALAVYLEHNARVKTRICPNMVLDRRNLKLRPSVYAARELAM